VQKYKKNRTCKQILEKSSRGYENVLSGTFFAGNDDGTAEVSLPTGLTWRPAVRYGRQSVSSTL